MGDDDRILVRAKIVFIGLLLASFVIVWRLLDIGLIHRKKWKAEVNQSVFRVKDIKPNRGNIYSCDGKLLSTSLSFYDVAIDPTIVDGQLFNSYVDEFSRVASRVLKSDVNTIKKKIIDARSNNKHYLRISNGPISFEEKLVLDNTRLVRLGRYKGGVIFVQHTKRFNPFGDMGRRTIGYVQGDDGVVGIECEYNEYLKGKNGRALHQRMAGDFWQVVPSMDNYDPVDGCDIVVTIDSNLEDMTYTCLNNILQKTHANYGTAIVAEVETGAIKVLVNLSADGNGGYKELYNYAVGHYGSMEPGSVMKLLSYMALFEETNLCLNDIINTGNGVCKFDNIYLHDTHKLGRVTVQQAFEHSSNVAVAKLVNNAFSSDPNKFLKYFHRLHLDKPLGLLNNGEAKPYIKKYKSKSWSKVTLPCMAIGYEMKLSPMHILTFYNAVANNGVMVKPYLVQSIIRNKKVIQNNFREVLCDKICSDKTLIKLKKMLRGVVEHGTGKKINDSIYTLSGKSGTANKVKDGKYSGDTIVTFVGFFPSDKPKYSCIIVVDDPKGKGYHFGSQVAGPVLKEIMDNIAIKDQEQGKTIYIDELD